VHPVRFIIRIYHDARPPERQIKINECCQLSANLYDIYHCCVYSEILLMMNEGIVRNM